MGMAEASSGSKPKATAPTFSMRMVTYGIRKAFPSIQNISCEQLEKWRAENPDNLVCLDTRPPEEYNVSHLPGAVRVDPNAQHLLESLHIPSNTRVVCYCSVGYRSSDVGQRLQREAREQGVTLKLYNMEGGIFQWACDGREMVDQSQQRTEVVHPYSSFWGNLLPSKFKSPL